MDELIEQMRNELQNRISDSLVIIEFEVLPMKSTPGIKGEYETVFGKCKVLEDYDLVYPNMWFHASWINFKERTIQFQCKPSEFDCYREWYLKELDKQF